MPDDVPDAAVATVWLNEEFSLFVREYSVLGSFVEFTTLSGKHRIYPSQSIDHVAIHEDGL